jgi:hypothetical protein
LPTGLQLPDFFARYSSENYAAFWGSAEHPHWNDGYWCWKRMEPGCMQSCQDHAADNWPEIIRRTWRDPILRHEIGGMRWTEIQHQGAWVASSGWPTTRGVSWAFGPSAWCLVNLKVWRDVGRWRDGCTFYEGHFGVRLAQKGYLSLNAECPPWLHKSGLAFQIKDQQKHPRHHEPVDGPHGILERDFGGRNGTDHQDLANYTRSFFGPGELDRINQELSAVKLYAAPGWEKWE